MCVDDNLDSACKHVCTHACMYMYVFMYLYLLYIQTNLSVYINVSCVCSTLFCRLAAWTARASSCWKGLVRAALARKRVLANTLDLEQQGVTAGH